MRSFWTKVDSLETWHAKFVDKPWLQPLKPTRIVVVLIILSTLIAAGMNWYVRHWQYQVWEQNPEIFYLDDGTPLFTTTDAPYFLGIAKAIRDEGNVEPFQKLRLYPTGQKDLRDNSPPMSLMDVPLLSVILSFFSQDSSQKSLLKTGNALIPVSAILTAFMIIFAFGAAGYWIEGTVAAAGGALSFSYLTRSGAGRIDTDQLNLGFFYLMTGLVIFTAKTRSFYGSLILAGVSGAVFWIFDWWYSKPIFGWAFLVGLVWLSVVAHHNIKQTICQAMVFLIVSGLALKGAALNLQSPYLTETLMHNDLIFPNTFDTITELRKVELTQILSRISGSVWLGGLSVVCLVFWGLRHPALAIVFGPATAFMAFNFVIGNRAVFYSAPMLWFGFAWALIATAQLVSQRIRLIYARHVAVFICTAIGFIIVWVVSPTKYVQGPSFSKNVVQMFSELGDIAKVEDAAIITWWDYGYTSMFMNQMPTLHDGGLQTSPATFFVANNLLINSQERAANRFVQLKSFGSEGIIKSLTGDSQLDDIEAETLPLYLVLTKDMANWIPSISKIGNWDIINGKSKVLTGVPSNYQLTYENLSCEAANQANRFICNGIPIDTATGQFGSQAILDGMVVSRDGRQLSGQKFNNSTSALMLHSEIGERGRSNMLIHRDLYFSVFHQLFHAGRQDERHFELVYDDYPSVRVFKVK